MRRAVGSLLCIGGIGLLSVAVARYATGLYRSQQARAAWDAAVAQELVAMAESDPEHHHSPRVIDEGAPMARLIIPRIGLDEIVLEGVGQDELDAEPGHVPRSAYPGEPGNSVISAHRDRHFNHLDAVQVGDTLETQAGYLDTRWIVVGKRIVGRETPALFATSSATLTLTTCWPIRYIGSAPDRLVITARPIGGSKPRQRMATSLPLSN